MTILTEPRELRRRLFEITDYSAHHPAPAGRKLATRSPALSRRRASWKDEIMAGKINAGWHRDNPMPKNLKPDQRIAWHLAHAKFCQCRPIPEGVKKLMAERGIALPPDATENPARVENPATRL